MTEQRHMRGFTLIELLIVVAIIGIIAAIAIPNLLNSIDRTKQKRTMSDLHTIGVATEAYSIDHSAYPTAIDISALQSILQPTYTRDLPVLDGWGGPLTANSVPSDYTVGSEGKDGAGGLTACPGTPMCGNANDAIIFSDGQFLQWPEGVQR